MVDVFVSKFQQSATTSSTVGETARKGVLRRFLKLLEWIGPSVLLSHFGCVTSLWSQLVVKTRTDIHITSSPKSTAYTRVSICAGGDESRVPEDAATSGRHEIFNRLRPSRYDPGIRDLWQVIQRQRTRTVGVTGF